MRRGDGIANAVRLLTAVGAVVAKPDLLTALKSGTSVYDTLKSLAVAPPASVARLGDALTAEAQRLFDATSDLPPDAEVLFVQMVEAGVVAAPEIVTEDMDAAAVTEAMIARLEAAEHRTPPMLELFRALTTPVLACLFADNAFADDLRAAFMREVLRRLGDLTARLDEVDRLTRLEMTALGDRFEIEGMYALSDAELREALEKRAEDFRAYRAQIEAIDERVAGLGNLKAAAKDAAERLDFDEVEALLARVDEVETEVAAETKVLRAENALLRGRAEDAYWMLSAAANGFASVSKSHVEWRLLAYSELLHSHGASYGGTALQLSRRMIDRVLGEVAKDDEPLIWASAHVRMGNVLTSQAAIDAGAARATRLRDAIAAFRCAQEVYTPQSDPFNWAASENGLGNARSELSKEVSVSEGVGLVDEAISSFNAILDVFAREKYPSLWAKTKLNLGSSLRDKARFLPNLTPLFGGALAGMFGDPGAAMLSEAVVAYREALEVLNEEGTVYDRAAANVSLGTALREQAARVTRESAVALYEESIDAFSIALDVLNTNEQRRLWAFAQSSRGGAVCDLLLRTNGVNSEQLADEAEAAFRAALEVYDKADYPVQWAGTQETLGQAFEAIGDLGGNSQADRYRASLESFDAVLEDCDPVQRAFNYDRCTIARARVAQKFASLS